MEESASRTSWRPFASYPFFFGIILMICVSMLGEVFTIGTVSAHASTTHAGHTALVDCVAPAKPTGQSLLVVLLDRSGSLIGEPGATDPKLYSTSVTKALADLWPGNMAVIPFRLNTTTLPILGPATLSQLNQRTQLKESIEKYPIGGGTPLAPAMKEALTLLQQQGTPAGSRVVVITDGNPTGQGNGDGQHQEQEIRGSLISQFCSLGVPVSAFGLTINSNTPGGQDANKLLTDITIGTGAPYKNVTQPKDLAQAVISLYAQWQGLAFTPVQGQNNFPVSIDSFAQQVSIVSFRSDTAYPISLLGPDKRPLTNGVEQSYPPDRHYEIDSLNVSGPILPGVYTVSIAGDPDAQVYALVNSPLQVHVVTPTVKTQTFTNRNVQIQAEFTNNGGVVTPGKDQAAIVAKVTLLVNGQATTAPNPIILTQQTLPDGQLGPIFSGETTIATQPGQLQIDAQGNYQEAIRETNIIVPVVKAPVPPCSLGFWGCLLLQVQHYWAQHHTQILGFGLPALLLLLLLFWWTRPSPFGELKRDVRATPIPLGQGRTLGRRLFRKSTIGSDELEADFPGFVDANFNLIFQRGRVVSIQTKGETPPIKVVNGKIYQDVKVGENVPLIEGSNINVSGRNAAIFTDN